MPRSDDPVAIRHSRMDWLGWFCLSWFAVLGILYAKMILASRAPGLLAMMRSALFG